MKNISIFSIIASILLFAGCQDSKVKSNNSGSESSCHTCFTLETTQEVAKKPVRDGVYYFPLEDNIEVYSSDGSKVVGTIIKGYGVKEVKEQGDNVVVKAGGFIKEGDDSNLYADADFNLIAITLKDGSVTSDMELSIPKDKLTKDENSIWSKSEFLYYDNCSMCHAAHSPKEHTIQEWEGIYGAMKAFAMPTEEDDKLIWEYLKAHSKGSFALDDE